jgi:hypothetical protein
VVPAHPIAGTTPTLVFRPFAGGTPCGTSPDECNEATNDPWGLGDASRGLRRAGALDTALGAVPDPSQARNICEGEPD